MHTVVHGHQGEGRLEPGWVAPGLTALAGVAYLLGYLETAFFASRLGITARDLGIDVKDYAVLALANVALVAAAAPGFMLFDYVDTKRPGRVGVLCFGLFIVSVLVLGGVGFGLDGHSVEVFLPVGVTASFAVLAARERRINLAGLLAVLAVAGLVFLACYSADSYAGRLRDDARHGPSPALPPLALRSILQPEAGIATQGTATTCAIRVSPHVLLGRAATTVVTPDRFTVTPCVLAATPFG